jgi:hypothetical protein
MCLLNAFDLAKLLYHYFSFEISFFHILFYHFYIYLHVYTLLGPPPLPALPLPDRTCSVLLFSSFIEEKT